VTTTSSKSGISTGAIVGIVLGAIACAVTLSAIVTLLILRTKLKDYRAVSKRRRGEFLITNQQVYCYFVTY
jgi:orotate phosphoribosyltransferase